jgi:hypothetical protein
MGEILLEVARTFESISFTHVFQELNQESNGLSKEGQQLGVKIIPFKEVKEGDYGSWMELYDLSPHTKPTEA